MSGAGNNNIVTEVQIMCCASCGKSELDDVKLMECADCKSVRYCSDECQKDHRPEHEVKCKERATELRDVILFKQPESRHHGDCPICCVPLPIDDGKRSLYDTYAAVKSSVVDAHTQTLHVSVERTFKSKHVHSAVTLFQNQRNRPTRI